MQVRFFNIVWDTDGEETDLPKETVLEVPDGVPLATEGADELSDHFGFFVESFEFEELANGGTKRPD